MNSVRLDKWLWAARFFKTRGLAKKAIEGGKVHYNGARAKTSKTVEVGALIRVPQGWELLEVEVVALSDQRRGAPEARGDRGERGAPRAGSRGEAPHQPGHAAPPQATRQEAAAGYPTLQIRRRRLDVTAHAYHLRLTSA